MTNSTDKNSTDKNSTDKQGGQKPGYIVHAVPEDDVTIDWFFGAGHLREKIGQGILALIGWFFAILPIVITASALIHRNDPGGAWNYREGFAMWDVTIDILGMLAVVFVIGFLALYFVNRYHSERRNRITTYDAERLGLRLSLADELYDNKYGSTDLRLVQGDIRIEPYGDIETYELRDLYRTYEVD